MDDHAYWIGFDRVRGIGSVRTNQLLEYFGDLKTAWQADADDLRQVGLPDVVIGELLKLRAEIDLEKELGAVHDLGISIVTIADDQYPQGLRSVPQAPPVLYMKGQILEEDQFAIAVVGTRRKTSYGKQVAEELAQFLAANGITVISGLARGIDTIAHQGALDAGGRTIAVMGCGLDITYPPENRQLSQEIIQHGALVSEFFPGTQPEAVNFPPRNRIISGLARAVVVVEADERSGALITAKFAIEQSRDVFAVPGSIYAPRSRGTNRLISDGAIPLLDFKDLLLVLNLEQTADFRYVQQLLPGDETELLLLETMRDEPLHIDEIQNITGLAADKVSAALTMMELKGFVRKTGNMTYQSVCDDREIYEV
jgi:DNA processing protein